MTQEVQKARKSKAQKLARLLTAAFDPRAWAHLFKIVNYYNYTHVAELRRLTRGEGCNISPTASFSNAHNIRMGARVSIGAGCTIMGSPGSAKITISDDVLFAPNVLITATNYRFNEGGPVTQQAMKEADIHIGRDVWLGAGVIVLAGARIGDGAIVAAGTIVRKEVPAWAIVAGPDTKEISQRTPYEMAPSSL